MAAERWPLQLGNKNGIKQTVRVRNKGTQGLYVKHPKDSEVVPSSPGTLSVSRAGVVFSL